MGYWHPIAEESSRIGGVGGLMLWTPTLFCIWQDVVPAFALRVELGRGRKLGRVGAH